MLRTRITRSPHNPHRRLRGVRGTLARVLHQRLDRRLHESPPPGPDPPRSRHPPRTRHRQCKLIGLTLIFWAVYHFWCEGGLSYEGWAVLNYVPHASTRVAATDSKDFA